MRNKFFILVFILSIPFACSENPVTGRRQFSLLPESQLQQLSRQQYSQFLSSNRVLSVSSSRDAEMVKRVGSRIASAITSYYQEKGLSKSLEGFQWEFQLVQSPDINAWCMPGGKVVVYTGLLPVAANEAGLAVVMGHEIAHAIALHGNERMSQGLLQQMGGIALQVALLDKPAETRNLFMAAYGVGTTVGAMLPFSRKHELEADRFGLLFSAMAGYNPSEAVPFWQRMAKATGGANKPPEFLSTHPSDETRISKMKHYTEEANSYYVKSTNSRTDN
jgi:predicted Zn-dependent protease